MDGGFGLPNPPPCTGKSLSLGYALEAALDLSNGGVRQRISPDAIRGFIRLASAWGLQEKDARALLGGMSGGAFYAMKSDPSKKVLDQDQLTRISLLLGISKALRVLYSEELADTWISLPNRNPMFGGATPLAYMVRQGLPGMERVRQLLDGRRGS